MSLKSNIAHWNVGTNSRSRRTVDGQFEKLIFAAE
jgi:hypothetical protein